MNLQANTQLNTGSKMYAIDKTWFALFTLIILHSIMPIVGRAISSFLTTYFLLGVVGLIYLYFIKWNINRWIYALFPLLLVTVVNMLWAYTHGDGLVMTVYSTLLGFTPVLLGFRLVALPYYQKKKLFNIVILMLLATAVTSIVGLASDPGAARYLATVSDSNEARNVQLEWKNVGGFSFTYILLTIYPVMICYAKEMSLALWKKIVLIAILLAYYISAEYMTGLMGFVILSALWFMPRKFSDKKLSGILIILLIVFLLLKRPIAMLLYRMASSTSSSTLYERFVYMANSLLGISIESDVGLRGEVLQRSVNGFLEHPLLGNWYLGGRVGGHSYILDFICKYGIIGISMLIWSYKRIYDLFFASFRKSSYFGYAMASFGTAIILSLINTGNHWFELTLIIPLMLSMVPQTNNAGGSL